MSYEYESNEDFRVITINLSKKTLKALNGLIESGTFLSRTAIVRLAIREFLKKEYGFIEYLEFLGNNSQLLLSKRIKTKIQQASIWSKNIKEIEVDGKTYIIRNKPDTRREPK